MLLMLFELQVELHIACCQGPFKECPVHDTTGLLPVHTVQPWRRAIIHPKRIPRSMIGLMKASLGEKKGKGICELGARPYNLWSRKLDAEHQIVCIPSSGVKLSTKNARHAEFQVDHWSWSAGPAYRTRRKRGESSSRKP